MKTALELILEERQRQIEKEGYTSESDDDHSKSELAMAAACYAAPTQLYEIKQHRGTVLFQDPYPFGEEVYSRGNAGYRNLTTEEKKDGKSRVRQLQIAGALILADLERELRKPAEKIKPVKSN